MKTPCIEWSKSKCRGYGQLTIKGRHHKAHRLAYAKAHGLSIEDIKGMHVRHRCDNPACINPEHLELGTHADNMRDMAERGRANALRGEMHPYAKLTWAQVQEIRRRYKPRDKVDGARPMSKEFGVDERHLRKIAIGKHWRKQS